MLANKRPTKKELREHLEQEVEKFLSQGGEVKNIENGKSGDNVLNPWSIPLQFNGTREERHPVGDLLKKIDARKRKSPPPPQKSRHKPRKHWIYDDFGEPVRWVWK
ncbi:hypothetical protein [Gynuella sunshinyii]|nr:hypothetical protein [Gynuella sunshinyii]